MHPVNCLKARYDMTVRQIFIAGSDDVLSNSGTEYAALNNADESWFGIVDVD